MRYRAERPDAMLMVELDAMTALFHRRSGQTHIVADPVPVILAELAQGPAELSALAARLGLPEDDEPALAAHLEELCAIGLVQAG